MPEDWKKPLQEIPHHLATAALFVCMLLCDFAPVALVIWLMRASEWMLHDKIYSLFGTPLETIMTHVEVSLLLSFMVLGGIKILYRLYVSIREMNKP
jgi:hypothetical protein